MNSLTTKIKLSAGEIVDYMSSEKMGIVICKRMYVIEKAELLSHSGYVRLSSSQGSLLTAQDHEMIEVFICDDSRLVTQKAFIEFLQVVMPSPTFQNSKGDKIH